MTGYIYVIKNESGKRKLGKSTDVEQRVHELQTGNDEVLSIEYTLLVEDITRAENAIHEIFSAYRKRGEWFDLDEAALETLRKVFGETEIDDLTKTRLHLLGLR